MDRPFPAAPAYVVAAPDHPSLDEPMARFAAALRAETRYFGRRAAGAPKPLPSLIRRLVTPAPGVRLAAVVDGDVVGVARVDTTAPAGPELLIAVVAPWRGRGIARSLGAAVVARAAELGVTRLVVHTTPRAAGPRALGRSLGFDVVDVGRGRLDLIRRWSPQERTA